MKKHYKKLIAIIIGLAIVFSVPIASKKFNTQAKQQAYKIVWSDEFNDDYLDSSNWNIEMGKTGWGNNERQNYTANPENLYISNGSLKIHALRRSSTEYTSARITTKHKRFFTYGKIEARMRLPRFTGCWPAFWMLGENIDDEGWPACGEMDIMEAVNNNDEVFSNLHWSSNRKQADTSGTKYTVNDRTAWHTYGMEWDENRARFYVDGIYYQTFNITDASQMEEFRKDQFIILNLAIGGNLPGQTIDDSAFPDKSTMEVDYVRVYQLADVEPTSAPKTTTAKNQPTDNKSTVKVGNSQIKKVTRQKKALKLNLKKVNGVSGYQIRYSTAKNLKKYKDKKTTKTKITIKKLKRKTTYYIKVRAYKKLGSVYSFGNFSKVKKVKTK
ncbi:MAG: glycoside hydrolase family 16 protein [Eubacterium sp.]|nr:glycoside hydrolase family 16 protein [Eubacterium sp.]